MNESPTCSGRPRITARGVKPPRRRPRYACVGAPCERRPGTPSRRPEIHSQALRKWATSRSSPRPRSSSCSASTASSKSDRKGPTGSSATPMGAVRRSHFTRDATFPRFSSGRSPKTSTCRSTDSSIRSGHPGRADGGGASREPVSPGRNLSRPRGSPSSSARGSARHQLWHRSGTSCCSGSAWHQLRWAPAPVLLLRKCLAPAPAAPRRCRVGGAPRRLGGSGPGCANRVESGLATLLR